MSTSFLLGTKGGRQVARERLSEMRDVFFGALMNAAEAFTAAYKAALEVRRDAEKSAPMKYIGDRLSEERRKIADEFNETIENARDVARKSFVPFLNDLKAAESEYISYIDTDSLSKLNAISDMPLTKDEIRVLSSKYGDSFWSSKMIARLAEANGVNIIPEECYCDRLGFLNSIEVDFEKSLLEYKDVTQNEASFLSEDAQAARAFFNRDTITDLSQRYIGVNSILVAPEATARIYLDSLRHVENPFDLVQRLRNVWNNASDEARASLCREIISIEHTNLALSADTMGAASPGLIAGIKLLRENPNLNTLDVRGKVPETSDDDEKLPVTRSEALEKLNERIAEQILESAADN